MKRPYRIINLDHGPNTCGSGDLILFSHIAHGSRGTDDEIVIRSSNKIDILRLLNQPHIDELAARPIGLSPKHIFGIEQSCRAYIPRYEQIRRYFNIKSMPKRPQVLLKKESLEYASEWWRYEQATKVLFCIDANDKSRRWQHWTSLADLMNEHYTAILTKENCDSSWYNAAAIISMADVVVAVDSAYAHLAATLAKPTVVIMGPTRPTAYAHVADCVTCLVPPNDSCGGCVYNKPFHDLKCGHNGCNQIERITPEQVLEEVKRCLK